MASKIDIRKLTKELHTPTGFLDLQCLQRFASRAYRKNNECAILELGTLNCVSAIVMADSIQVPGLVTTVDNYVGHTSRIGKESSLIVKSYAGVKEEVNQRGLSDRIRLIKGNDIEWLTGCDPQSLDMLVVDSMHCYDHVIKTLEIGLPKMKADSVICGHDYTPAGVGVVYAVEDFRRRNANAVCGFGIVGLTWWCLVRNAVEV